jgi:hypothetical protein
LKVAVGPPGRKAPGGPCGRVVKELGGMLVQLSGYGEWKGEEYSIVSQCRSRNGEEGSTMPG